MHHANHFYGHAHVMARYAGLAEVPTIWGYLQHGWNAHDGYAVGTPFVPGYPRFVWSEPVARRGLSLEVGDHVVVGAPWSYLLSLRPPGADTPRQGTIAYPFHGWEGQPVRGRHDRYARQLREVEGDVPITVCLYWHEFEAPAVRRAYGRAGFRVITHGPRGQLWQGTREDFLDRQLRELRVHRRVVSNRMGTALLYGASTGAEIGIYGDPMVLHRDHAVLGGMERQRRLLPELHQPHVPASVAADIARRELRTDRLLPPAEIRQVFGWHDEPLSAAGGMGGGARRGLE